MRPITNILLVLALICYLFLPFYDISMVGTRTGLGFTAGTISQALSLSNVLVALLPFIACFGAIALNSLKRRWWVLGAIACIFIWLWFYMDTATLHDIMLRHAPEVTPDNDLGEGFSVIGLGIGYCCRSSSMKLSRELLMTPSRTGAATSARSSNDWKTQPTSPTRANNPKHPPHRLPRTSLPKLHLLRTRKTRRGLCPNNEFRFPKI